MPLETILFEAHSGTRWLVVLVFLIIVVRFGIGMAASQSYDKFASNLLLAFAIILTLQWVLGLVYWVYNGLVTSGNLFFGAAYRIPHLLVMTVAVGASHAIRRRLSGGSAKEKYGKQLGAVVGIAVIVFVGVVLLPAGFSGWLPG